MEIIRKEDQSISKWSGGETRQLYIYPPESSLANRDFFFRVSTATIEREYSTFTKMPGYFRVLTLLEGELKLVHKNQHTALLKPFDSDDFLGDFDTECFGKGVDFNAIGNEKYTCMVHVWSNWVAESENKWYEVKGSGLTSSFGVCFYLYKGILEIKNNETISRILEGDFVYLNEKSLSESPHYIKCDNHSVLIEVQVDKLFD